MNKTDYWLIKKSRERYWLVFLFGFFMMIIPLIPLIIKGKGIYVYYGDYNAQQIPFYNLANDAVRDGQLGWNWYTDLGSDLISSYSFYLIGSPFFWVTTILPRCAVTYSMPFLLAIKHGIATLTSYIYIRKFVRGRTIALTGALLYAFSGFQIYNIFFNHFQDVTAFFPLMLISMEENINNHRKGWFAVTVALMAFINYYFFCGQVVFLIIYYLFRMKCPDFHTSWKKFFILCMEAIIGTAIAAVILLPSFLCVIYNPRVVSKMYGTEILLYDEQVTILKIIQAFFMPSDPPTYPILFDSEFKWSSRGGYFPLFGMLGVITFMRTHREHWATRISYCMIIFAFIPVLNSLFQMGNSYYYARWFYMPILIFAMMSARTLDEDMVKVKPSIIFSVVVLTAFIVQSLMPAELADFDTVVYFSLPNDFFYFIFTVTIALFSLIIAGYLFDLKKRGKRYEKAMLYTTVVFGIGLVFNTMYYGVSSSKIKYDYKETVIESANGVYENVSENNFFRIDISGGCDNFPMFWKLPTIRAFHSVVNSSIMEFYNSLDIDRGVASRLSLDHFSLRGLLSTKYYYKIKKSNMNVSGIAEAVDTSNNGSLEQTERLMEKMGIDNVYVNNMKNVPITEALPGFEYVGENEFYEIYENKLFITMGIGYDNYVSKGKADQMEPSLREKQLMRALILSDEQIDRYSDILTEIPEKTDLDIDEEEYREICKEKQHNCSKSFKFDSYGFVSEIELDKPQLVFFSVPYSKGWSAEVNGKATDIENVDSGFMAVMAEKGENTIIFHYKTPGLKYGIIISILAFIILMIYLIISRLVRGKEKEYGIVNTYDYISQGDAITKSDFLDFLIYDKVKISKKETDLKKNTKA